MPLPLATIIWPAVVRHGDDPELTYIADEQPLYERRGSYLNGEQLIDSAGKIFLLSCDDNALDLHPTGEVMALNDFLGLVKAHAAQGGSCCVAKLHAPSIADAMAIVASLEDDA